MLKKYLIAPGPTPVPEKVLLEMTKPVIHHRTSEFSATFEKVANGLKKVFSTEQDVLMLAGSGTAAMEAAVVNTLNPGDNVLVINAGKFGQRWRDICKTYGILVSTIDMDWGKAAKPEEIEQFLKANPDTKAVLLQGSETSTTVYHPVEEIAKVVRKNENTLLIVDGITSIGVHDTKFDEWGIDIAITGSQKAFMLPPGLSLICLSKKAWNFVEKSTIPRYYLDLRKELKSQKQATTAYTPALTLINGLAVVLEMFEEEGLENVYKRHAVNGEATRAAVKAMGFKLLAETPSNAATGFYLPEDIDGGKLVKFMREKVGITYAGGQDHLKGRIVRISHLGYHDAFDTITAISGLEMGLRKFGVDIKLGSGIAAAEEILQNYIGE
ncbi:aminotransferase class V [Denitrovibrio acetiphilus DSM 12809]|uniref:Aminotransferase class V n=1 Tax=Denitrovibrio acetiphilus (strain DSM 12809 / NBRC 114555 / N2460) TaxID=522772 RepID=D4H3T2_DENA2|nr:alanine--glyoxylate aminotransferase family protein [Denitrovibrio acetiphilus]ADD69184.1 aminotransferase class V [Denitrovibrio acetiphilus DSM 12809]